MLGPLTIGCSIFSMQDHDAATGAPDLWSRLDHAVCRGRRDRGGRLAVDDSKKLKGAKGGRRHPLHHLERGVLAFLGATEDAADWLGALDDIDVLSKLGASVPALCSHVDRGRELPEPEAWVAPLRWQGWSRPRSRRPIMCEAR